MLRPGGGGGGNPLETALEREGTGRSDDGARGDVRTANKLGATDVEPGGDVRATRLVV